MTTTTIIVNCDTDNNKKIKQQNKMKNIQEWNAEVLFLISSMRFSFLYFKSILMLFFICKLTHLSTYTGFKKKMLKWSRKRIGFNEIDELNKKIERMENEISINFLVWFY